jgi:ribosomal-protein-alanine N-acetyltransferase
MDLPRFVRRASDLRLETERLVLRRLGPADAERAIADELDPRIMRHIRDLQTREQVVERVQRSIAPWTGADGEWLGLAIVPRDAEAMVGVVGCRIESAANETVEIGYRLQSDVHRRGFAYEASRRWIDFLFGEIGARKLVARCVDANEASYRLLEKLGMRREGLLREYTTLGGALHDELLYGLLAREWRVRPQ